MSTHQSFGGRKSIDFDESKNQEKISILRIKKKSANFMF